jgi:hypothetical protein
MLVEDGEHFGVKELIDTITSGDPHANYLLEVDIFSFRNYVNVIFYDRHTLAVAKVTFCITSHGFGQKMIFCWTHLIFYC